MIGILTTLSLALSPAVAPAEGAPVGAPVGGAVAEPAPDLLERLEAASVERLRLGSELGWPDVEAMVDRLVAQFELGERAAPASPQEAGELAVLFQDLAIGTTPLQRLGLVVRCQSVLDLGLDDAVGQRLVRAQLRLLEPLVARSGAADSRDSVLERGLELYESIEAAVTDPLTGEAPDFLRRSRLRIQRLRVGSPMPRFVARDTAGNELRSAQLEGNVLVLRFWDAASAASLAAHRADADLVRDYWDAPFDLIGVTSSEDRAAYLDLLEEVRFGGVQLFDGPISVTLADALARQLGGFSTAGEFGSSSSIHPRWGNPVPGSQFIVDARGRIRGRDLSPEATRALVDRLIQEEQSHRRSQFGPSGSSR
jgi:hypothetical protein